MDICVDFDGTCVKHEYPKVGGEVPLAVETLRELHQNGHKLILFTMRSGKELNDAVEWFDSNEIPLYGVNRNPTQDSWTASPKAYGQIYIDDAACGCPLSLDYLHPDVTEGRPFVDWYEVRKWLQCRFLI